MQQKYFELFVFRSVLRAFLNIYIQSLVTILVQTEAAPEEKCQQAENGQIKNEGRRRYPTVCEVPVLNLLQFFVVFALVIHIQILWCKNNGCLLNFNKEVFYCLAII